MRFTVVLSVGRALFPARRPSRIPSPAPPLNINHKAARIAVLPLIIFLTAMALRLYQSQDESIWFDESVSAYELYPGVGLGEFMRNVKKLDPTLNPLYFTGLWVWSNAFGCGDDALRAFSILLGSMAIVFLYYLAKELFEEWVDRFAVVVMGLCSICHVYYSQEIRMYALYLLLSTISLWSTAKVFKSGGSSPLFISVVANILLMWTHIMAVVLIAFESGLMVWHDRKDFRRLLKWGVPQALNLIVWWLCWGQFLEHGRIVEAALWINNAAWDFPRFQFSWIQTTSGTLWGTYHFGKRIGLFTEALAIMAMVGLLWELRKNRKVRTEKAMMVLLACLPAVLYLASKFIYPCWIPRDTIFAQTGVILSAVIGAGVFGRRVKCCLLAVLVTLFMLQYATIERPFRPNWKKVGQLLADGRPVIVFPKYEAHALKKLKPKPVGARYGELGAALRQSQDELQNTGGWLVMEGNDPVLTKFFLEQIGTAGLLVINTTYVDGSYGRIVLWEVH